MLRALCHSLSLPFTFNAYESDSVISPLCCRTRTSSVAALESTLFEGGGSHGEEKYTDYISLMSWLFLLDGSEIKWRANGDFSLSFRRVFCILLGDTSETKLMLKWCITENSIKCNEQWTSNRWATELHLGYLGEKNKSLFNRLIVFLNEIK